MKNTVTRSVVISDLETALLTELALPLPRDDDITARRMAEQSNRTPEYWRKVLDHRPDLIKVKCYNPLTRRPVFVYRPKPK